MFAVDWNVLLFLIYILYLFIKCEVKDEQV